MDAGGGKPRRIIALAASHAEERAIERVLDEGGIAWEPRLDLLDDAAGVCFLGCGYAVDEAAADRARELLEHAGITVVDR